VVWINITTRIKDEYSVKRKEADPSKGYSLSTIFLNRNYF